MKKTEQEIQKLREQYPTVPEYALPKTKNKKSSPTNQLQHDIIVYVFLTGGYAFRVNTMGVYSEFLGKYVKSGATVGVSDILACYNGKLICIEVKRGRDKIRPSQAKFQSAITKAGAPYIIASDMDSFRMQYDELIKTL